MFTDVTTWTCNCGQQKFLQPTPLQTPRPSSTYAFLAPSCPPSHADGMAGDEYADPDEGSITDGDDHVWLGNPEP